MFRRFRLWLQATCSCPCNCGNRVTDAVMCLTCAYGNCP